MIVNLVDQQQVSFSSLELTVSQALNAANDASADEDSDSSQSSSSKKKEKVESINPKSHFIDPPTLEQEHIRTFLRTTMAKAIRQSNDSQIKANPLWTDKYAPTAVNEVCGNIIAVKFLSAWMSKWKTQKTKERKRKNKSDDDDEVCIIIPFVRLDTTATLFFLCWLLIDCYFSTWLSNCLILYYCMVLAA